MKISHLALFVVSSLLAAACSKSEGASSTGAPAASTASHAAAGGIVATCAKGKTVCVEYKNAIPSYAEEMCNAGPDYVWSKSSTPCPTANLLGKCTSKSTPDEVTYWYGDAAEADVDKGLCEALGQWTPASALAHSATPSSTPAPVAHPPTPAPAKKKK